MGVDGGGGRVDGGRVHIIIKNWVYRSTIRDTAVGLAAVCWFDWHFRGVAGDRTCG